jgi:GNAT superfamily N-acetyltransferase
LEYIQLKANQIDSGLFSQFSRRQVVTQCWRKIENQWIVKDIAFIDDWNTDNYCELIKCLKNTNITGGIVYGALEHGILKGFSSVEPKFFGTNKQYLDLSSIHVSEDMRGKGIGKALFGLAVNWAKYHGAKKLYISAHSSVESQAFYKRMGCVEALEYDKEHTDKEPYDCQLEYVL